MFLCCIYYLADNENMIKHTYIYIYRYDYILYIYTTCLYVFIFVIRLVISSLTVARWRPLPSVGRGRMKEPLAPACGSTRRVGQLCSPGGLLTG